MSLILTFYNAVKENHNASDSDPRTRDLPLVSNYFALCSIIAVYIIFVLKLGPAFMANRKPYNITALVQVYNCFQVLFNLYIFIGTKYYIQHPNHSWICTNIDKNDSSPVTMLIQKFTYLYFINKLFDLVETVFFVLRKKNNQISFLHLYHHTIMIYAATIYNNFLFGTHFTIIGIVNSFVHVIMYIYYFLAARTQNKESLFVWKRRMTQLQILQFFFIAVNILTALLNNTCGLPYFWLWVALFQNIVIVGLFSHFYYKSYILKPRNLKEK